MLEESGRHEGRASTDQVPHPGLLRRGAGAAHGPELGHGFRDTWLSEQDVVAVAAVAKRERRADPPRGQRSSLRHCRLRNGNALRNLSRNWDGVISPWSEGLACGCSSLLLGCLITMSRSTTPYGIIEMLYGDLGVVAGMPGPCAQPQPTFKP